MTSNSYGTSNVDNDGFDAASQEADIIHNGAPHDAALLDRQRRAGYGTTTPPTPVLGHQRRRLDAVRRHRLGLGLR